MDNRDPAKEKLHRAMDTALLALGELHATIEANTKGAQPSDDRTTELAGLIWKGLAHNTRETDLGNVSLPHHTVATLLLAIKNLEMEKQRLKQTANNRNELLDTLSNAYEAFNNPRITDRDQQNQAAIKFLGFRRSRNNGESWLSEYQSLVEGGDHDPIKNEITQPHDRKTALKILADKYGKSEVAMYGALNRAKRSVNKELKAIGNTPVSVKLPPNPGNKTK